MGCILKELNMKKSKIMRINIKLIKQRNMLKKSVKKDILAMKDKTFIEIFKRGDYTFLESLIQNKNRVHRVVKKINYDICPIPKDLRKLINIDSEILMNKRITNSKPRYFKGNIIITDPCYVLKDIDVNKVNYIERDTIYGDWSCNTINTETNEIIGHFCADSGMVAVINLDDVLKLKPDFDDYKKEYAYTVIENFDGYVKFNVTKNYFECDGKKCVDYSVSVVGKGNVNFKTIQSDF
jgi:hypothetical protein